MRALIQRVSAASVVVEEITVGAIGRGLAIFLGVGLSDNEDKARQLARKACHLRLFPGSVSEDVQKQNQMRLSVGEINGSLLIISQFTLYADVSRGNRPSFSRAAASAQAKELYECFIEACRTENVDVQTGTFGAQMQVNITNDGPVTLWCDNG